MTAGQRAEEGDHRQRPGDVHVRMVAQLLELRLQALEARSSLSHLGAELALLFFEGLQGEGMRLGLGSAHGLESRLELADACSEQLLVGRFGGHPVTLAPLQSGLDRARRSAPSRAHFVGMRALSCVALLLLAVGCRMGRSLGQPVPEFSRWSVEHRLTLGASAVQVEGATFRVLSSALRDTRTVLGVESYTVELGLEVHNATGEWFSNHRAPVDLAGGKTTCSPHVPNPRRQGDPQWRRGPGHLEHLLAPGTTAPMFVQFTCSTVDLAAPLRVVLGGQQLPAVVDR